MINLTITKKHNFLSDEVINVGSLIGNLKEDGDELVFRGESEYQLFYKEYSPDGLIINKTEFEIKTKHEGLLKDNLPKFILTSYKVDHLGKVEYRFKRAPFSPIAWHTGGVVDRAILAENLVSKLNKTTF